MTGIDLRTRIAAAIESIRIQRDGDAARMADAVIHELGLETQCHYDPDCDYYRYVTEWINPVTGNKIDLP